MLDKGKKTDKVKSYAAMRKISMHKDKDGIMRMQLNNKDCFQFGPWIKVGGQMDYIQLRQTKLWHMILRKRKIGVQYDS